MKHEGWVSAATALGVSLGPAQADQLDRFEALLLERAARLGIVALADIPRLRERHLLDCLRAAAHVHPAKSAYDLGSGGGLPGIPLAIAAPELEVILVEARRGRAAFLEFAIDELALGNAAVYLGRAEALTRRVDVITARAFAEASESWRIAEPLLAPGGRLIYFAGKGFDPARSPIDGAHLTLFPGPPLARSGDLAIMGRQ